MAIALLFAVTANADVIHQSGFDVDGAAQGTGFGIQPGTITNIGGGGDHVGTAGQGLSDTNPNSGSFAYVVDAGATADNGTTWGGATWAGIDSNNAITSGGFGTEADVTAAGVGSYINYDEGATFTASVMIATDAAAGDPLTGTGTGSIRLEFLVDGTELSQADRVFSNTISVTEISDTYSLATVSYTLDADDVANGINGVNAIMGTDGHGFGNTDGLIYFDDFLFEVDGAFVTTLAVPEPSSAVILAGLLGLCGLRRKKN
jgi:hypothetical protein